MFALKRSCLQKALKPAVRFFGSRKDNFMSGENASYADQMYDLWKADPKSVHPSWSVYFSNLENDPEHEAAYQEPPFDDHGVRPYRSHVDGDLAKVKSAGNYGSVKVRSESEAADQVRLVQMIDHYRRMGHLGAVLDPLREDEYKSRVDDPFHKLSEKPSEYGFSKDDLDKPISIGMKDGLFASKTSWTPREVAEKLEQVYTGSITFEYMHIPDRKVIKWVQERIEAGQFKKKNKEEKLNLLDRVAESQAFSDILEKKYPSSKRYGAEGCDSGISGMEYLADLACESGVKSIIVGMPHRGRFNIMGGMFQKKYSSIFTAFNDPGADKEQHAHEWGYSSDVKYHLGANTTRHAPNGNTCDLVIASNLDLIAQSKSP